MEKNLIIRNSSVVYFFSRLYFYFKDFLNFYFVSSFRCLLNFYKEALRGVEKNIGLVVHLRYFFVPLWQVYSFLSYLLSIPIRLIRIIISLVLIIIFTALFIFLYGLWLFWPLYLIYWI